MRSAADLTFAEVLSERPAVGALDAVSTLRHFAIVTYAVDPARLKAIIPPRFALDEVEIAGSRRALLSVVPFEDENFRWAGFPCARFRFGQTNYRVYVRDQVTGRPAVWFLGTVLGSWAFLMPRLAWRLPWHRGKIRFDCELHDGDYQRYSMTTRSSWASAQLELEPLRERFLPAGFKDEESALVFLTHPLVGFYHRTDGSLGTYSVWHERLRVAWAGCRRARFDLLDRLGLVPFAEQDHPHSVLVQPNTEFTIYLPPQVVRQGA